MKKDSTTSAWSRAKRTSAWAAVAVLFGAGVYFLWLEGRGSDVPPEPVIATADLRVVALGEILPVSDVVTIAAPTGQDVGRISEIRIAEGADVEEGQVLAVLDTRETLSAKLAQAEADVEQRQAALEKLRADLLSDDANLEAQMEQQRAERDRAAWDVEKFEKLSTAGVYDETALIDRRLALQSADFKLKSSEIALRRNREVDANGVRVDEASAVAELASAEALLAQARADYEKAFVKAPIAGRIIKLYGRDGQQISADDGFAEIADTSVMYVRAEVFETDLPKLAAGMIAEVNSRALDQALRGRLERIGIKIARQSIVSSDPSAIVDARVVEVWVRLNDVSSERVADLSNLQVRVTFNPAEADNA